MAVEFVVGQWRPSHREADLPNDPAREFQAGILCRVKCDRKVFFELCPSDLTFRR